MKAILDSLTECKTRLEQCIQECGVVFQHKDYTFEEKIKAFTVLGGITAALGAVSAALLLVSSPLPKAPASDVTRS